MRRFLINGFPLKFSQEFYKKFFIKFENYLKKDLNNYNLNDIVNTYENLCYFENSKNCKKILKKKILESLNELTPLMIIQILKIYLYFKKRKGIEF